MSADPIMRLAKLRIIKASADLEVQLASKGGGGPAIEILRRLRDAAAESLSGLPFLNFDDPTDILKAKVLANEVKRYDEWVVWLRSIIHEGIAYDDEMSADEREEMLDLLTATPDGQRQALELGLLHDAGEVDAA